MNRNFSVADEIGVSPTPQQMHGEIDFVARPLLQKIPQRAGWGLTHLKDSELRFQELSGDQLPHLPDQRMKSQVIANSNYKERLHRRLHRAPGVRQVRDQADRL